MKKIITILVSVLSIMVSNSQEVELDWAKQIGGTGYNIGYSIATDSAGNTYTTGYFSGTADFDPGIGTYNLTSFGDGDIFILKMNSFGDFLWAKQFGGNDYAIGLRISLDNLGNIYLAGIFENTIDVDPSANIYNLSAVGINDAFVAKMDSSGNFIWAKQFGGVGSEIIASTLDIDNSGNIYTIGYFSNTVDFDPGVGTYNLTSFGEGDIFISKLDSSGSLVWVKRIGGINTDEGEDIKVDDLGNNIYITGGFRGTIDFDPNDGVFNMTSSGSRDIFISKLDTSGNLIWANRIGSIGADRGHSIALDNIDDFLYITGEYSGSPDFDPGIGTYTLTSAGGQDCFVIKLDVSGNFIWARSMGGSWLEEPGNSIQLDSNGDVIVTGWFWGTSDFDPGVDIFNLTSVGNNDIFIVKLNSEGGFSWAKNLGGEGVYINSWSSALDTSDNIYTTGNFDGTVDFDQGIGTFFLTPFGASDIFIHKMRTSTLGLSENNYGENFKIYPNPTKGQLQIVFGNIYNHLKVTIRNQLAQIIPAKTIKYPNRLVVNFEGSAGIYYVEIRGYNGELAHFKILKEQ